METGYGIRMQAPILSNPIQGKWIIIMAKHNWPGRALILGNKSKYVHVLINYPNLHVKLRQFLFLLSES